MALENRALMAEARDALRGKWGLAMGGFVIYMAISILISSPDDIGSVLSLILSGPLMLGLTMFSLALARRQVATISQLFLGFQDFLRTFLAYILMCIFILLWLLLLIVPGIIAGLSYAMTFFILAEDKAISARDAIKKSKAMMMGHKKKLFFLTLRFVGWFFLSILTAGIGFLWSMPYFYVTIAKFYDDIKGKTVPIEGMPPVPEQQMA